MTKSQRQQLFIEAIESAADLYMACKQLGVPTDDIKRIDAWIKRLAAKESIYWQALPTEKTDQLLAMVDAVSEKTR